MALDPSFTGGVINALPMDKMISAPLQAMIQAQTDASRAYAEFLQTVCIKDGKAVTVDFEYDESIVDSEGKLVGIQSRTVRVPLMSTLTHPVVCLEEGTVDFELEVTQSEMETNATAAEAAIDGSVNWGIVKARFSAKVSHSREQTRSTDTRAKYRFHTVIKRGQPPEAVMRIIDFITEASTKPVVREDRPMLQGQAATQSIDKPKTGADTGKSPAKTAA